MKESVLCLSYDILRELVNEFRNSGLRQVEKRSVFGFKVCKCVHFILLDVGE